MGHLFLLPDVCEPPKAKAKAKSGTNGSNKRPRSRSGDEDEQSATAAASDSDACSQCTSEHARAQNDAPDSASASRSDDLESLLESLDEDRAPARQGASWGRAMHGADEQSAQSSSNSTMSSFRGGRGSSSATRTSSKRSRTTVCVGWSSLRDDEDDVPGFY